MHLFAQKYRKFIYCEILVSFFLNTLKCISLNQRRISITPVSHDASQISIYDDLLPVLESYSYFL